MNLIEKFEKNHKAKAIPQCYNQLEAPDGLEGPEEKVENTADGQNTTCSIS